MALIKIVRRFVPRKLAVKGSQSSKPVRIKLQEPVLGRGSFEAKLQLPSQWERMASLLFARPLIRLKAAEHPFNGSEVFVSLDKKKLRRIKGEPVRVTVTVDNESRPGLLNPRWAA